MSQLPQNVCESVKSLNPHLYGGPQAHGMAPRIRQSQKPLMNKLEQEWFDRATLIYHEKIMPQALGFRLGNGVVYWPDFVSHSFTHAWEIKGRQPIQDDSAVKIKVAARLYPQIKWSLVWKQDGNWKEQIVLP